MCIKAVHVARHEKGIITLCKGCQRYSLTYGNASFCFMKEELATFQQSLANFKEQDFCFEIMGEHRAVLQNKYFNLGFSVSRHDIQILYGLIDEALLMSEVHEILDL